MTRQQPISDSALIARLRREIAKLNAAIIAAQVMRARWGGKRTMPWMRTKQ